MGMTRLGESPLDIGRMKACVQELPLCGMPCVPRIAQAWGKPGMAFAPNSNLPEWPGSIVCCVSQRMSHRMNWLAPRGRSATNCLCASLVPVIARRAVAAALVR